MNAVTTMRRLLAGAGALALGLAGLATTANADETANIDFDATGSITVTKYAQPAADATEHDGTELDQAPGHELLDGVEFTVRPVAIDLETNEGWAAVNALDAYVGGDVATANGAEYTLGEAVVGTTGTDGTGVVVFDDLAVGVYLVQETNIGANPITNRAAPFYVAIPLPQESGQWLYDVFVYPKNAVTSIEKSVDESAALALGSTVSWPIRVTVPQLTAGTAMETFTVTDTLDHRLGFDRVTVTPAALVAETHYTVARRAGTDADGNANVTVEVDFTEAGLAELEALQGSDVVITVDTTVNAIGEGTIVNDALVNVNDYEGTTNKVHSKWGAIKVFKYASVTENGEASQVALEGAEFKVFASHEDALALTNPITVVVDGIDVETFVSDAQGNIVIPGLLVDNASGERNYWVVETKAPAGYDLPANEKNIHEVLVKAGSIESVEALPVLNVLVAVIGLPLTGGAGTAMFSVAGMTLIGIAVAVVVAGRRRAATSKA